MVAAAFKGNLVLRNAKGQTKSFYVTMTDVNAAKWVFPSGETAIVASTEDCWIVDLTLSASGTDTTNSSILYGGEIRPEKVIHSANVATVLNRQFSSCPMRIPGGTLLSFTQNT